MSGDVQPRKRKDKRKKKDDEELHQQHGSVGGSDEVIHVHKENKLGGNICSKIIFFGLLGALGVMVGLIIIEYHGSSDVETQSAGDSPWSVMLEGWVDEHTGHDDHGDHDAETEHQSQEVEEHEDHDYKIKKYEKEESAEDNDDEILFKKPSVESNIDDVDDEDTQETKPDDEMQELEEDETSGGEDLTQAMEGVPGGADVPPSFVERRQTLIPAEIMEAVPGIDHPQEDDYGQSEHEDEGVEEVEDVSFVKQTFEDLKAAYNQITPDESDADTGNNDPILKTTEYETTESEPEASETEEEDEEEEQEVQEDDPLGQWRSASGPDLLAEEVEDAQTESETEEESESEASSSNPISGGPKSNEEVDENQGNFDFVNEPMVETAQNPDSHENKVVYDNADITNQADWEIREELDEADQDLDDGNPSSAFSKFSALLTTRPDSPRALFGKARALDALAESQRSNSLLTQTISAYSAALQAPDLPDSLLLRLANRTIDRMRFRGLHESALDVHKKLIQRFPANITYQIELAVTYLIINRLEKARSVLEEVHKQWPRNSLSQGYLGLTYKLQGHHDLAIPHLISSVQSNDPQTVNSHFYFHLGDALQRKGQHDKALEIYEKGVSKGIFRSKYQRSLYNVERLKAQPWWKLEETTYSLFFKKLESNWKKIKIEGLAAYTERQGYLDEAESLKEAGDWKQYELFARGQKNQKNCKKTPVTCQLIEEMNAAKSCRRGQVKFSIMEAGTHVWPHCGPTNCRLRAHLGLIVPPGTAMRVADQTRTWEEGKVVVFDDSFEHEVWHNGTSQRLVLIVDVWHPELSVSERQSLTAI